MLVLDNGPMRVSKLSLAALAARAHWLTVEWLPKHAAEPNDWYVVCIAALDHAIHAAVVDLIRERMVDPLATPRITDSRWDAANVTMRKDSAWRDVLAG